MALPHTRTLGDQQRDPQHAGNHVQRTPNVKRQTRETSAAMSSNAVQGPKVMSRHSTPSTDSSTQRRHRSLHLRSKRHDSAVHDTLNEREMHGTACGRACADKAWDSGHGARAAGQRGWIHAECAQGEQCTCIRPAILSSVGRAPNVRRSGSRGRARRAKAPLVPTRAGGRVVQRCNGRHHATSASAPSKAERRRLGRRVSNDTLRKPTLCE
jgi:hypothetical protein